MRKLILISIFYLLTFTIGNRCYSQLTVNIGKDTTYCLGLPSDDPIYLAENITIEGGVEPYTIAWECNVPEGLYSFYTANDFLNDTTIFTPYFINWHSSNRWIKFTLNVTDSENNYAKESINIRFSKFSYLLGYSVIQTEKGDKILFNTATVGGGIEPLTFHWQPTTGLTDPENLITWCETDVLTQWINEYSIVATDSCGCVSEPNLAYEVRVLSNRIDELNMTNSFLNIKQQGSTIYFDNPLEQRADITLFSLNGKIEQDMETTNNNFEITDLIKIKGTYILKISLGENSDSKKIINY